MALKLDTLISSGLSGLRWEAAALALSRESRHQGERLEVVHERASRGFLSHLSYGEFCVCLVIRVTYILSVRVQMTKAVMGRRLLC